MKEHIQNVEIRLERMRLHVRLTSDGGWSTQRKSPTTSKGSRGSKLESVDTKEVRSNRLHLNKNVPS